MLQRRRHRKRDVSSIWFHSSMSSYLWKSAYTEIIVKQVSKPRFFALNIVCLCEPKNKTLFHHAQFAGLANQNHHSMECVLCDFCDMGLLCVLRMCLRSTVILFAFWFSHSRVHKMWIWQKHLSASHRHSSAAVTQQKHLHTITLSVSHII